MSRKHAALQRRVARFAADWRDVHDELPWSKREIVKGILVLEDGEVTIKVTPPTLSVLFIGFESIQIKIVRTQRCDICNNRCRRNPGF